MPNYKTPGAAIEEIAKLPPSIAESETAIPVFIGLTVKTGEPVAKMISVNVDGDFRTVWVARINSLLEYETLFGKAVPPFITVTILDSMNGNTVQKRSVSASVEPGISAPAGNMYYHMQLYFANGGGPCYITSVGLSIDGGPTLTMLKSGVIAMEQFDEPTLLVIPDSVAYAELFPSAPVATAMANAQAQFSLKYGQVFAAYSTLYTAQQNYDNDASDPKTPALATALNDARAAYIIALNNWYPTKPVFAAALAGVGQDIQAAGSVYEVYNLALDQCGRLKDRFTIIDCFGDNPAAVRDATYGLKGDNLKYGAVYYPSLETSLGYTLDDKLIQVDHRQDTNGNGVFDIPVVHGDQLWLNKITANEVYNAAMHAAQQLTVTLNPSAAIAGVYASVDRTRGVWKAPANVSLSYVTGVTRRVSDAEQEGLNDDPLAGKSINVIRNFTGKGTLVWGARTLDANSNDWRYISVRRLFIMIEESITKAVNTFALEPNDQVIWLKVQGMIENYLTTLWRAGALQGARTKDAFYVSVGMGKTMSAQDVLEGRMIVEVGVAAVRPAEFIVLQFSHMMARS